MRWVLLTTTLLLLVAPLLGGPPGAVAHHSVGRCSCDSICLGVIEISPGRAEGTFYVDERSWWNEGVWVYAETNGIWYGTSGHDDLQRGGVAPHGLSDDSCRDVGEWVPDTLIF